MVVPNRAARAEMGVWLSVLTYVSLMLLKLVVGAVTGSLSLQADGYNNVTDLVASLTLLAGLRIARRPRDENHPYGHGRAEAIASLITSVVMAAIALQVLYTAAARLAGSQQGVVPDPLAAWVGGATAAVMFGLFVFNRRLAANLNNLSLWALSKDNLSDALVSLGAVFGIVGAQLGAPWLDPLAALGIGIVICHTSWTIFKESAIILTDGFDEDELMRYRQTVLQVPGVRDVADIRARMLGRDVLVDVTIMVNPDLNVVESHRIADATERELRRRHKVRSTFIHVEPCTITPSSRPH